MAQEIVRLRDRPELLEKMVEWFQHTFGFSAEVYRESMRQCLQGGKVPQWYVWMDGETICGGMGVIENDFHSRPDLAPNVCAVYVDEPCRGRGIAGKLLRFVCEDMAGMGIGTLYLVTDHTSFYERYGWEFYCMADTSDGPGRVYRHITPRELSLCGDDCLACPRRQARTQKELGELEELWHRVGWRDRMPAPEEMGCTGCSSRQSCAYGLKDCVKAHRVESCGQCGEYPCGKISSLLEKSQKSQARCRALCSPEEYARLERAFFHKEENLGRQPDKGVPEEKALKLIPCTLEDLPVLGEWAMQMHVDGREGDYWGGSKPSPELRAALEKTMAVYLEKEEYIVFRLRAEGDYVGYVVVKTDQEPIYIRELFVAPEFRRRHYGTRALEAVLEHFHTQAMELEVFVWNHRAEEFYKSFGFRPITCLMSYGV